MYNYLNMVYTVIAMFLDDPLDFANYCFLKKHWLVYQMIVDLSSIRCSKTLII